MLNLLLNLLLCSGFAAVEPACSPVEEGKSATLTCDVDTAGCSRTIVLTWRAGTAQGPVVSCTDHTCYELQALDVEGGSSDFSDFSATINSSSSALTINRVSRTGLLDMQTRWTCRLCHQTSVTACNSLQIYALPQSPECTASEDVESGDVKSVTVTCSTSRVYPRAKCSFYRRSNGDNQVKLLQTPDYSHTETGTPGAVYYRSRCSVRVPVQELGEGTHSFLGYIYPGVLGDETLVPGIAPEKEINLSFPQASHGCSPPMVEGYFREKLTNCSCSLEAGGRPWGTAQWFKGDQPVGSHGALVVTFDKDYPEQIYTCETTSSLGRKVGSTLTAKFAFDTQVESLKSKGSSLNTLAIGIGVVVAVVILAGVIIVVFLLLKKQRVDETDDHICKVSSEEMSTIRNCAPSSTGPPRISNLYGDFDDILATTNNSPRSSHLFPESESAAWVTTFKPTALD